MNELCSSKKEPVFRRQESIFKHFGACQIAQKCSVCGDTIDTKDSGKQKDLFKYSVSQHCKKCSVKNSSNIGKREKAANLLVHYSSKMTQSCSECHEVFLKKSELQAHMVTHDNFIGKGNRRGKNKFSCNECSQAFCKKTDLHLHRKTVHSKKRYVCHVCKKAFDSEKRLKMHSQFHNVGGEFKCYYCDKQFNKAWKMKIHLINHTGKPPFICQYCGEDFLYPGKIVNHLKQVHDMWHPCKDCGGAFKYCMDYDRHSCKVYCCKDCTMSFSSFDELATHAASHINETSNNDTITPDMSFKMDLSISSNENNPVESSNSESVRKEDEFKGFNIELNERSSQNLPEQSSDEKTVVIRSYKDHPCANEKKIVKRLLNYGQCNEIGRTLKNDVEGEDDQEVEIIEVTSARKDIKTIFRERNSVCETFVFEGGKDYDVTVRDPCKTVFSDFSIENVSLALNSGNSFIEQDFKVPEGTVSSSRKCSDLLPKSLQRKQEEFNRSLKKKLGSKFKFCVDSDGRHALKNELSFESWLSGDTPHDFVFGFGANGRDRGISCSEATGESHCQYFSKMVLKKEKSDMSFEDLCLF
ncbi:uncharacterized protein [Penaeus vannamei]|uniref:uncharacterized protein n=1 Tax=Penaeus vannamei TaxID=6689 RepID=UPI00387F6AAF